MESQLISPQNQSKEIGMDQDVTPIIPQIPQEKKVDWNILEKFMFHN
jgi:hypothetical protein